MKRRKGDEIHFIESDKPEFNMMAYYMKRMDMRSDERDLALNEGDIKTFYRATMTLLMNSIPRFVEKGMTEEAIQIIKSNLMKIGSKLKNISLQNEQVREKNKLQYEEELFEYNIKLNLLMFKYGLIYPTKDTKTVDQLIEADF